MKTDKAKATGHWKDNGYIVAVLLYLYNNETNNDCGVGFAVNDIDICSSISEYYLRNSFLTPKQFTFLRRTLPKYQNQIPEDLGPIPIKNKTMETKSHSKKAKKTATLIGKSINIKFPYDPKMISKIKTLSSRKWNAKGKIWRCSISVDNIEHLQRLGFEIDEGLLEYVKELTKPPIIISDIPGIGKELLKYQKKGVSFIEARNGRIILGDEQGLGKTIQALAWLQLHPEIRPALVVCPASLKLNWAKEVGIWMESEEVQIINSTDATFDLYGSILIINYDILHKWRNAFLKAKDTIKTIILDECQKIKNPKARRSQMICGWEESKKVKGKIKKVKMQGIASEVDHVLGLSGTPITSKPVQFWPIINLVNPQIFPSFWNFVQKYCNAKNDGFGWNFNGHSNTKELHEKLTRTCFIRRKKSDVLKDLPPKTRSIVPIEYDKAIYQKAWDEFNEWLELNSDNPAAAMVEFGKIKKAAVKAKMPMAIKWIKTYLDSGKKLVLFAHHKDIINQVMDAFPGISVKIDGSVDPLDRQKIVDQFQEDDKIRLFVGNIVSAGIGLTLTAASDTCTIEFLWDPSDHTQAEDRTHRIGQTDHVTAYYLVVPDSIEVTIMEIIERKAKILDQILDGEEVGSDSIFTELLRNIKGE